jgi:hypothetical protein
VVVTCDVYGKDQKCVLENFNFKTKRRVTLRFMWKFNTLINLKERRWKTTY